MGNSSASVDKNRHASKAKKKVESERNLLWILGESVRWQEQGRQRGILHLLETEPETWQDLASQYAFIYSLMDQMIILGVETHKIHIRLEEVTKKMLACKRPVEKQEIKSCETLLMERYSVALHANDNVRAACQWLKAHFTMGMKRAELESSLADKQAKLDAEEAESPQHRTLDKAMRKQQQELNELLKCAEVHERHLLGVNLHYLDRNFSGCIETSDMPDLPASLFNLLDKNMDHKISADEIEAVVLKLEEDLRKNAYEMQRLKAVQVTEAEAAGSITAGLDVQDLTEAQRLKLETLHVKRLKTEETLRELTQKQIALEDDKTAIYRTFTEEKGFVPDMRAKTDRIRSGDLLGTLRLILKEPEAKSAKIGLADTDIKTIDDLLSKEAEALEAKQSDEDLDQERLPVGVYTPGMLGGKAPLPSAPDATDIDIGALAVDETEEKLEEEKEEQFEEPIKSPGRVEGEEVEAIAT